MNTPPVSHPTRSTRALLALAALVVTSLPGSAQERRPEAELDVVTLLDGTREEGQVVYQDDTQVIVRKRSRETALPRAEVEHVDSRVASLHQLLDTLEGRGRLLRQSPEELLEQAAFAQHSRLPGEARLLQLAVLLSDPEHAQANELLDNQVKRKRWHTRRGRDWVATDELDELPGDWDERWTLQTAHYELRTNLSLSDAILTAFDLERLYRAVFELIGPVVELREPREVLVVQLHADEASFPEPGSGRPGQFSEEDRIAYATSTAPRWRTYLFHEVVRQLLFVTSEFAVNAKGRVPLWLSTGLAEAFARSSSGAPGATRFAPEDPVRFSHEIQARAKDPFELTRVLVFTDAELSVRDEHQALRFAECTTLAQYLLSGDASIHRPGFHDFLRSCWQGKGSPSHLKDALVMDLDDLQEPWLRYVARIGGT